MTWGVRARGTRSWANGGTDPVASGSLTATGDAANARVQLTLAWTAARYANIYRSLNGQLTPVRTAFPVDNATGTTTAYDSEVPLDTAVVYVAYSPALAYQKLTSASVTVASSDKTWLGHPTKPELNRIISINEQPEKTRGIDRGVFPIIASPRPITVTAGVRSAPTGTLGVYVSTLAERDGVLALLADGAPLLLRPPTGYGWDASTWISIGDVLETPTTTSGFWPMRVLTLPYIEVDAPSLTNPLLVAS